MSKKIIVFLLLIIIFGSGAYIWYKAISKTQSFDTFIKEDEHVVEIYYPNRAKDPKREACDFTYPTKKKIMASPANILLRSMEALVEGPTEEEKAQGIYTSLPKSSELVYFDILDGQVDIYIDYNKAEVDACGIKTLESQIKQTLFQFSGINSVRINPDDLAE